jgi:hypothetical protein
MLRLAQHDAIDFGSVRSGDRVATSFTLREPQADIDLTVTSSSR